MEFAEFEDFLRSRGSGIRSREEDDDFPHSPHPGLEWSYDWSASSCGTTNPTPRPGRGTLWFALDLSEGPAVHDLRTYFSLSRADLGVRIGIEYGEVDYESDVDTSDEEDDEDFYYNEKDDISLSRLCRFRVIKLGDIPETLLTGIFDASSVKMDSNVGNFAVLQCADIDGLDLMHRMFYSGVLSGHGYMAFVPHCSVIFSVGNGLVLLKRTGTGPDETLGNDDNGLSTLFQLVARNSKDGTMEEVARCLMSYRDGSWDPSFGPTITMMTVRQHHRGKGLLALLWHWVRAFVEDNISMECLHPDAPFGHVMVKASQLQGTEVETISRKSKRTGMIKQISVTDKDFFYKHLGFSLRPCRGPMAALMEGRHPKDQEGVLYIPLISSDELLARFKGSLDAERAFLDFEGQMLPGIGVRGKAAAPETEQKRTAAKATKKNHASTNGQIEHNERRDSGMICAYCRKTSRRDAPPHSVCSRCRCTWYCDVQCQARHWNKHKIWCSPELGKT